MKLIAQTKKREIMDSTYKNIISYAILGLGFLIYCCNLSAFEFIYSTIVMLITLLGWVTFNKCCDNFNNSIFIKILSISGLILSVSVFFFFGIEEVPIPRGAIVFHAGGIAGSLGIGLFSLFPLLILRQINSDKLPKSPEIKPDLEELDTEPELFSDDYEMANDDDLQSGDWETA